MAMKQILHNFNKSMVETILQACHFSLASIRQKIKMKSARGRRRTETSALSSWCFRAWGAPQLKCALEEADVHCGPGLLEMWRPGHMEVDGGIQLVSTGPQRAHSSTRGEKRGVACPLPHKWTTQQSHPKGKSCVVKRWTFKRGRRLSESIWHLCSQSDSSDWQLLDCVSDVVCCERGTL